MITNIRTYEKLKRYSDYLAKQKECADRDLYIYFRLLEFNPHNTEVLKSVAYEYKAYRIHRLYIHWLNKVQKLHPHDFDIYYDKSMVYYKTNQLDKSLDNFRLHLSLFEHETSLLKPKSLLEFHTGKYEACIHTCKTYLQFDSSENSLLVIKRMAECYDRLNQYEKALKWHFVAASFDPNWWYPWKYAAFYYYLHKRPFLSLLCYLQAYKLNSEDPELLEGVQMALDFLVLVKSKTKEYDDTHYNVYENYAKKYKSKSLNFNYNSKRKLHPKTNINSNINSNSKNIQHSKATVNIRHINNLSFNQDNSESTKHTRIHRDSINKKLYFSRENDPMPSSIPDTSSRIITFDVYNYVLEGLEILNSMVGKPSTNDKVSPINNEIPSNLEFSSESNRRKNNKTDGTQRKRPKRKGDLEPEYFKQLDETDYEYYMTLKGIKADLHKLAPSDLHAFRYSNLQDRNFLFLYSIYQNDQNSNLQESIQFRKFFNKYYRLKTKHSKMDLYLKNYENSRVDLLFNKNDNEEVNEHEKKRCLVDLATFQDCLANQREYFHPPLLEYNISRDTLGWPEDTSPEELEFIKTHVTDTNLYERNMRHLFEEYEQEYRMPLLQESAFEDFEVNAQFDRLGYFECKSMGAETQAFEPDTKVKWVDFDDDYYLYEDKLNNLDLHNKGLGHSKEVDKRKDSEIPPKSLDSPLRPLKDMRNSDSKLLLSSYSRNKEFKPSKLRDKKQTLTLTSFIDLVKYKYFANDLYYNVAIAKRKMTHLCGCKY